MGIGLIHLALFAGLSFGSSPSDWNVAGEADQRPGIIAENLGTWNSTVMTEARQKSVIPDRAKIVSVLTQIEPDTVKPKHQRPVTLSTSQIRFSSWVGSQPFLVQTMAANESQILLQGYTSDTLLTGGNFSSIVSIDLQTYAVSFSSELPIFARFSLGIGRNGDALLAGSGPAEIIETTAGVAFPTTAFVGGPIAFFMSRLNALDGRTVFTTFLNSLQVGTTAELFTWLTAGTVFTRSDGSTLITGQRCDIKRLGCNNPLSTQTDVFVVGFDGLGHLTDEEVFLGGTGNEKLSAARLIEEKLILVGQTSSKNFFGTGSEWRKPLEGSSDGFIIVYNLNSGSVEFSARIGGPHSDRLTHVAGNSLDRIIVRVESDSLSEDFGETSTQSIHSLSFGDGDEVAIRSLDVPADDLVGLDKWGNLIVRSLVDYPLEGPIERLIDGQHSEQDTWLIERRHGVNLLPTRKYSVSGVEQFMTEVSEGSLIIGGRVQAEDSLAIPITNGIGGSSWASSGGDFVMVYDFPPERPYVLMDSIVVREDSVKLVWPLVNDYDVDGGLDPSSIELSPSNSASSNTVHSNGSIEYHPAQDFSGVDSIAYTVADKDGMRSDPVSISVVVLSVNDPPTFTPGPNITLTPNAGTFQGEWATDIKPGPPNEKAQSVAFEIVSLSDPDLFESPPTISPTGQLSFTTVPGLTGSSELAFRLVDNGGTSQGGQNASPTHVMTITATKSLAAPLARNPGQAQIGIPTQPTFSWSAISGASAYSIEVFPTGQSSEPILASGPIPDTSWTAPEPLSPDVDYEWRVRAVDADFPGPWSATSTFRTYPAAFDLALTKSFAEATDTTSYRMVSLPGNVNEDVASIFVGEVGVDWAAFHDTGSSSVYPAYLTAYTSEAPLYFKAGRGFWTVSKGKADLQLEDVATIPLAEDRTFSISLHPGWNIVGNPFERDLLWSAVESANPGIQPPWQFDGDFSSADVLRRFEGYYLFNPDPSSRKLTFPYRRDSFGALVAPKKESNLHADLPRVVLRLLDANERTATTSIIFRDDASAGLDPHDIFAPPSGFASQNINVVASDFETEYRSMYSDARPFRSEGQKFEIEIEARGPSIIHPDILLPSGEAVLIQHATNEIFRLEPGNPVDIVSGSYTLAIGPPDYLEDVEARQVPQSLTLLPPYPNPTSTGSTIRYAIPEPGPTSISVVSILGRRIRTLHRGQIQDGWHEISWDGRDESGHQVPSGVYVIALSNGSKRLTARSTIIR